MILDLHECKHPFLLKWNGAWLTLAIVNFFGKDFLSLVVFRNWLVTDWPNDAVFSADAISSFSYYVALIVWHSVYVLDMYPILVTLKLDMKPFRFFLRHPKDFNVSYMYQKCIIDISKTKMLKIEWMNDGLVILFYLHMYCVLYNLFISLIKK